MLQLNLSTEHALKDAFPISALVCRQSESIKYYQKKDAKIKFSEEGIFQRFLIIGNNFI